ncbi:MAG: TMCO1/EMC3 family protein [archaeon]|nr:TMCO1/EMC3 family protein [archaeon]
MFLRLDASLRNWIFFPVTIITICVSLLMKYLSLLFSSNDQKVIPSDNKDINKFDYNEEMTKRDLDIQVTNALSRSNLLKSNFMFLSSKGFKLRRNYFCKNETGYFNQKHESKTDIMNPNMMFDMIKRNVTNAIYYLLMFVGGGYFFSGFILLKLPFGLTQKFRGMMQQGLNLPDVDVSYVSAISWCLILVFGLNDILQQFDGGEEYSMLAQQEQMFKAPMQMMGPMKDYNRIFNAEKESVNILPTFSLVDDSVDNLLKKYEEYLI